MGACGGRGTFFSLLDLDLLLPSCPDMSGGGSYGEGQSSFHSAVFLLSREHCS